ncbi:MAG: LLM class flavin-dependent oxidoreductase, partial [Thaumarchaeota archaeon]|nr:LLM class flavin-dependent oxidoreductase [Nitrososphaerota archaeon]
CTVNSLARGRLQLGVGAGWYEEEYRTHGFEFPDLKARKQQFREALKIIRPLTQTGKVDFEGRFFSAHLEGLPRLKDRVHLIIGGKAPSVVRQTVTFGDEWNFYVPVPEEFDALKGTLDSGSRHIEIARMGPFMVARSTAQLKTRLRRQMRKQGVSKDEDVYLRELRKSGWLVGTESDFPERVNELRERGVEKFYFQVWETKEREQMEQLARVLKGM